MSKEKNQRIIIYQVLPRLFGNADGKNVKNGSIEENGCGKMADFTTARLRRIRSLGCTHIWYTGLIRHATQTDYSALGIENDDPQIVKGKAGSPYAIKDYYDIDPDLSVNPAERMKEFEALLERTHKEGMKFIIDFVPNHVARAYKSVMKPDRVEDLGENDRTDWAFSPQNNFYYIPDAPLSLQNILDGKAQTYKEKPARATGNNQFSAWPDRNDWYETVKLNYGVDFLAGGSTHFSPLPSTWKKMTDILLFWAAKGVDGFRCDMAEMVPSDFWHYAINEVKAQFPNIVFIAEVYNPNQYREYIHHGGFDFLYDKVGLYDTLKRVVRGEQSAADITHCWQAVDDIRPQMLNFLENHDEQRIASPFFAGDAFRALPALVVSTCLSTSPFMLYSGEEIGERGMEKEGFSGQDGRTTIFDYWSVESQRKLCKGIKHLHKKERELYDFHQKLLTLQNENAALREGSLFDLMYVNQMNEDGFNPHRHFAFLRHHKKETLLIVVNFSEWSGMAGIRIPRHAFDFLKLKEGKKTAEDLLTGNKQTFNFRADEKVFIDLPAQSAVILSVS